MLNHIIELKKLKVNNNQTVKQQKLIDWLKFILNPNEIEVNNMEGNEDIKAAKKVLERISQDKKEREKIKIAKEMKKQGIENSIIAQITELTIEEVENLN